MTENEKATARYSKGEHLAIVHGKANVGVQGEIFWAGANKYGPGFRYGLKDNSGETYWVDEADLGPAEGAPPPPKKPVRTGPPKDPIDKGATVEITGGKEGVGQSGEVFWVGDSKFGQGLRYGVKNAEGTTYWVDEDFVTQTSAAPPRPEKSEGSNEFQDDFESAAPAAAASFNDEEPPLQDDDVRYDDDDFSDEEMPF